MEDSVGDSELPTWSGYQPSQHAAWITGRYRDEYHLPRGQNASENNGHEKGDSLRNVSVPVKGV